MNDYALNDFDDHWSDEEVRWMISEGKWPTEEYVREQCLKDICIPYAPYAHYDDWWDSYTSGISRLIRRLIIEEYIKEQQ